MSGDQKKLTTIPAELKSTGHNVIDSAGIAKWGAARARLNLAVGR